MQMDLTVGSTHANGFNCWIHSEPIHASKRRIVDERVNNMIGWGSYIYTGPDSIFLESAKPYPHAGPAVTYNIEKFSK